MSNRECGVCGAELEKHQFCDGTGEGMLGCGTCFDTGWVCSEDDDHDWRD